MNLTTPELRRLYNIFNARMAYKGVCTIGGKALLDDVDFTLMAKIEEELYPQEMDRI